MKGMTALQPLTFGSCFAGCGGLDLGLKMAGLRQRWWLEIDDDARDVLAEREPDAGRWDNIKTFLSDTASERRGSWGPGRIAARRQRRAESAWAARWRVDVLCGGFPCQDISYAGYGAGLAGKRSSLWYEFARVVRTLRPRYVLVENVSALLTRGLDAVLGTLASYGYVGEWTCLQAADLGAPHLRDRIFIIGCLADAHGEGQSQQEGAFGEVWRRFGHGREDVADATLCGRDEGAVARPSEHQGRVQAGGSRRYVPHADRQGLAVGQVFAGDAREELAALERGNRGPGGCWEFDPADVPESGLGRMVDGISYRLHKGAARNKMLGNAVSPPVGEYLGRRIVKHYLKGA